MYTVGMRTWSIKALLSALGPQHRRQLLQAAGQGAGGGASAIARTVADSRGRGCGYQVGRGEALEGGAGDQRHYGMTILYNVLPS